MAKITLFEKILKEMPPIPAYMRNVIAKDLEKNDPSFLLSFLVDTGIITERASNTLFDFIVKYDEEKSEYVSDRDHYKELLKTVGYQENEITDIVYSPEDFWFQHRFQADLRDGPRHRMISDTIEKVLREERTKKNTEIEYDLPDLGFDSITLRDTIEECLFDSWEYLYDTYDLRRVEFINITEEEKRQAIGRFNEMTRKRKEEWAAIRAEKEAEKRQKELEKKTEKKKKGFFASLFER